MALPPSGFAEAKPAYPSFLYQLCLRLGWNVTGSRLALLLAVHEIDGYKTAEELISLAQRHHPGISRATVYRSIAQLCAKGVLAKTHFGNGAQKFHRATPAETPVAEIYIEECGKVLRVPAPFLSWYAQAITRQVGLEMASHRLQTFARCSHKKEGGDCSACPREAALRGSTTSL